MIGILLALTLSIQCINTGGDKSGVLLTCNDAAHTELRIPISEWPSVWHGPERGFAYQLDANGQPLPSLLTARDQAAYDERVRAGRERMRQEGRRWRRPALQQPIQ